MSSLRRFVVRFGLSLGTALALSGALAAERAAAAGGGGPMASGQPPWWLPTMTPQPTSRGGRPTARPLRVSPTPRRGQPTPVYARPSPPPVFTGDARWYKIEEGDILETLARRFYGDRRAYPYIQAANQNLSERRMRVGRWIQIPVQAGEWKLLVKLDATPPPEAVRQPGASPAPAARPAPTGVERYYKIRDGDLLSALAERFYGKSDYWMEIRQANPGLDEKNLTVDRWIKVPELAGVPFRVELAAQPEAGAVTAAKVKPTGRIFWYQITAGDNFSVVAEKLYGKQEFFYFIQQANPRLEPTALQNKQWIQIPELDGAPLRQNLATEQPAATTTPAAGSGTPATGGRTRVNFPEAKSHLILPGETLGEIARHYYGRAGLWSEISAANPGLDPTNLVPGETIVIPAIVE